MTILLKSCVLNGLNVKKCVKNFNINLTYPIGSLTIFAAHFSSFNN
jgi:hypothetical protein